MEIVTKYLFIISLEMLQRTLFQFSRAIIARIHGALFSINGIDTAPITSLLK